MKISYRFHKISPQGRPNTEENTTFSSLISSFRADRPADSAAAAPNRQPKTSGARQKQSQIHNSQLTSARRQAKDETRRVTPPRVTLPPRRGLLQNPPPPFYPHPKPANHPPAQSPPQITPPRRGPHPPTNYPKKRNEKKNVTNPHSHTPPRHATPRHGHRRRATRREPGENGGEGICRRNGGRGLPVAAPFQGVAAPAQPGRVPPPHHHHHHRPADHICRRAPAPAADAADGRGRPAHLVPLLSNPPPRAAGEAADQPPSHRGGGGDAEGGGEGGGGGAAAGGVRGAAVPAVRGAAAVARRRAGVAVADVPAVRALLRPQLVEREGGRVRALGPPPRRPPRLLLLLPRHGLRHPRPGPAPPRRPRLPPLPPEQPPDPRPRRHRRRRHLPLHVHLRSATNPIHPLLVFFPFFFAKSCEECAHCVCECEMDRWMLMQGSRRYWYRTVRTWCGCKPGRITPTPSPISSRGSPRRRGGRPAATSRECESICDHNGAGWIQLIGIGDFEVVVVVVYSSSFDSNPARRWGDYLYPVLMGISWWESWDLHCEYSLAHDLLYQNVASLDIKIQNQWMQVTISERKWMQVLFLNQNGCKYATAKMVVC